jgi:hypothetical protein
MAEQYTMAGTIKAIGETQSFGTGDFCKRELVLNVPDGKYPQDIPIEFHKDNGGKLDAFKVGDAVTVAINIRGREYQGRYFCNIVGWKIDADAANASDYSLEPAPQEQSGGPLPF